MDCRKTATASVVVGKATVRAAKSMTQKGEKYIEVKKAEAKQRKEERAAQSEAVLDNNCQVVQEIAPVCS